MRVRKELNNQKTVPAGTLEQAIVVGGDGAIHWAPARLVATPTGGPGFAHPAAVVHAGWARLDLTRAGSCGMTRLPRVRSRRSLPINSMPNRGGLVPAALHLNLLQRTLVTQL